LYEENKKASGSKGKKSELKEFKFGPAIADGDLNTRIRRARDFIIDKNQVKFTVHLKGRQAAFPDIAREKLNRVVSELEDVARPDGEVKVRGPFIFVTFIPK
jgi:translation initiation factor IF-3